MSAYLQFEPLSAVRFVGVIYAMMVGTVWLLLRRRHEPRGLTCWCVGGAAMAAGGLLYGARGLTADWLSVHLANSLFLAAYALRVVALRLEMQAAPRFRLTLLLLMVALCLYFLADRHSVSLRVQVVALLQCLGAAWLGTTGFGVARTTRLQPARWIGNAYSAYALAMLLLLLSLLRLESAPPFNLNNQFGLLLALLVSIATGMYGNFGYVGVTLERLRLSEMAQVTALAHESAQRAVAEKTNRQLQGLLAERDNLIRVMAHEVRQPLNNASAALQAARSSLVPAEDERRTQPAQVELRVTRAQSVLSQVIGSLDNTLAATALLASPDRVAQQDTDVDLLVQLSLGDIDATQKHRVQVERHSGTRTASMDAGLMRLALRNLLSNALAYSDPDTPVLLRVSDSDDPLALVFEVIDNGPGVAPELAPRLFQRGERGSHEQPGHGLGLYVVMRVAELHDSRVKMQHRDGGGSIFRFILTQGRH